MNIPAKSKAPGFDDQIVLNYAIYNMKIEWKLLPKGMDSRAQGVTSDPSSLKATILSERLICRHNCKKNLKSSYYVWHPFVSENTGKSKSARMSEDNLWILNDNWNTTLKNTITAKKWLLSIT